MVAFCRNIIQYVISKFIVSFIAMCVKNPGFSECSEKEARGKIHILINVQKG